MSLEQRLLCQDFLERIERIENVLSLGQEAFAEAHFLQDAVVLSFIVIGEAVKSLDAELTLQHPQIGWKSIAGFRDILVH